jgi:hypothetical protein
VLVRLLGRAYSSEGCALRYGRGAVGRPPPPKSPRLRVSLFISSPSLTGCPSM